MEGKKKAPQDLLVIGREYAFATKPQPLLLRIFPKGKKTTPTKIPPDVTEAQMQFFFRNRKGKLIFKPMYEQYRKQLSEQVLNDTRLNAAFGGFKDTSVWERYMLNSAQFSAAKSASEAKQLQAAVVDSEGTVRSYSAYAKEASQISEIQNTTWLRVERDLTIRSAVMAEEFRTLQDNADVYPMWQYRGVMDSRERAEHVDLEAKIFRIGDADGDSCYPPNGWNCRCWGVAMDEIDTRGKVISRGADNLKHVDPQFRFNPAKQGLLPKEGHSYFEVLPNANEANGRTFAK